MGLQDGQSAWEKLKRASEKILRSGPSDRWGRNGARNSYPGARLGMLTCALEMSRRSEQALSGPW